MPFGISARRPVHRHALLQIFQVLLGSRQGDATMVRYRLWAHDIQSVSGWPGPKRASIYFIRREQSDFNDINRLQTSCFFFLHFFF